MCQSASLFVCLCPSHFYKHWLVSQSVCLCRSHYHKHWPVCQSVCAPAINAITGLCVILSVPQPLTQSLACVSVSLSVPQPLTQSLACVSVSLSVPQPLAQSLACVSVNLSVPHNYWLVCHSVVRSVKTCHLSSVSDFITAALQKLLCIVPTKSQWLRSGLLFFQQISVTRKLLKNGRELFPSKVISSYERQTTTTLYYFHQIWVMQQKLFATNVCRSL